MPLTPQVTTWEILELKRRLKAVEDFVITGTVAYTRITGLTANRLLGRHSDTDGAAELIQVGTGLALLADVLVATGGGGGPVAVASFTLICVDDLSNHEVTCVLDQGQYTLLVNQAPGGTSPVNGLTFTAGDATDHVLRLRLDQGFYGLEVVQAPGGSGAVASLLITCVTDASTRTLAVVLDQGFYTWTLT